jgi:hypothetical protein
MEKDSEIILIGNFFRNNRHEGTINKGKMKALISIKELLQARLHYGWIFLCPTGQEKFTQGCKNFFIQSI